MSDKPKNGNAFKIVIIVLLLLVVLVGATLGAMFFFKKDSSAVSKPKVIVEQTYPLGEFIINLLDVGSKPRYLKVNVYIGYEINKDLTAELDENKPVIRDAVNTLVRSKKTTDFSAIGLDAIKKELIGRINPSLTKGKITHIYFNDILVQ